MVPDEVEAARLLLRGPAVLDPSNAPQFERIARDCPDRETRTGALSVLGVFAQNGGDLAAAERTYREVLRAAWGTGWPVERMTCVNLATVFLEQARLFESLVLARRGCALSEAAGRDAGVCLAWRHLATLFRLIEDWPRLDHALGEAERRIASLPPRLDAQVALNLHHGRAVLAMRAGSVADAMAAVERAASVALPEAAPDVAEMRARVLLVAGRPAEAAEVLAAACTGDARGAGFRLRLDELSVRCTLATDGPDRARAEAVRVVERLRADPAGLSSGARMALADGLGRLLLDACGAPDDAWRAFDTAAAAALERMAELDRALRDLPALAELAPEDREILDGYRARFTAEHREFLAILISLVEAGAQDPRLLAAAGLDGAAAICVCAWCDRVRGPERIWIEPGGMVLPEGPLDVSHGICDACAARVARSASHD